MPTPIIIDAEVNTEKLTSLGYNDTWLSKALRAYNIKKEDIFLMTVDDNKEIKIIKKDKSNENN